MKLVKQKTRRLLLTLMLAALGKIYAQEKLVTGSLTDSLNAEVLPGVSVIQKGTSHGVTTDMNGKFEIKLIASGQSVLLFKFLGYKTKEVNVEGLTNVDVKLNQESTGLNEVVVTAIGISQEKKKATYAVQDIKGEKITMSRDNNFLNNLSGNIAGAQITSSSGSVGSSASIILRGYKSLTGANQPLFVVDGIPYNNASGNIGEGTTRADYGNAASTINPDDIETISVLKGAAATAIWGSRGANGVILVTTKSAKSKKGSGLGVDYSMNMGFETPFVIPKFQNKYGQGLGGKFQWVDGLGSGINDDWDQSWGPELNGQLIDQFTGKQQPWVAHPNNYKDFLNTGKVITNNVAVSGSNDKGHLRISYTNFGQKGMVPNTDLKRNTINVSNGYNLSEKFTVASTFTYVGDNSANRVKTGYGNASGGYVNPFNQFIWSGRQVDWNYLRDNYQITNADGTHTQTNWINYYSNNPFWLLNKNTNSYQRDRYTNNWLTAQGRLLGDYYSEHIKERVAKGTFDLQSVGGFFQSDGQRSEINKDLMLIVNRDITDKINVDGFVGIADRTNRSRTQSVNVEGLFVEDLYTTDNATNNTVSSTGISKKVVNSLLATSTFTYDGAIILGLTYRSDWSSAIAPKLNPYSYYSLSTAWIFTESFKNTMPAWFSYGKVRASYADVGNDTDPYNLQDIVAKGTQFNNVYPFFQGTVAHNPNLKPERTRSLEFGTDLKFFKNRLGLDVTYYSSKSYNQIFNIAISPTSGFTSAIINGGSIGNKGIEIQLYASPIQNQKGFNWDINANFSRNINKIIELDPEKRVTQYPLSGLFQTIVYAEEGQPFGSIYGYKVLRDPASGKIVVDADGHPMVEAERSLLGNATPKFLAGLTNTFTYANFNLSFLIDSRIGSKVFSGTNYYGSSTGVFDYTLEGRESYVVPNAVKVDPNNPGQYVTNDIATTAEYYWQDAINKGRHEQFVYDASFVKLRQASLGYELPKQWVEKIKLQGLNVSVYGRNLWLLYSKIPNVDPETAFSPGVASLGIEYLQTPSARTFGFTLRARF